MRAYREEQQGFPWGLLGLLGLLGLIPLFRGNGNVRTVYVERDEAAPRRPPRADRRGMKGTVTFTHGRAR